MKSELQELLTDLKAAVRIGHPESIGMALEGLFEFEAVAANSALERAFLKQVILPAGAELAAPHSPLAFLESLADEPVAALRAIAAAAFAKRYLAGTIGVEKSLAALGRDERSEVRDALVLGLGGGRPEQLKPLLRAWIKDESFRLQITAMGLVPVLKLENAELTQCLAPLARAKQAELRAALVECLTQIGNDGQPAPVLALLRAWSKQSEPNSWVIAKTLSASWAVPHAAQALELLESLAGMQDTEKLITGALKALSRHGADDIINTRMERWAASDHPALRAISEKIKDS